MGHHLSPFLPWRQQYIWSHSKEPLLPPLCTFTTKLTSWTLGPVAFVLKTGLKTVFWIMPIFYPDNNWNLTIWLLRRAGGGGGCMGDLVRVKKFFPNFWWNNFFPALYATKDFFFQSKNLFSPSISLQEFFPSKSICKTFFSEITLTPPPPKVKWWTFYGYLLAFTFLCCSLPPL